MNSRKQNGYVLIMLLVVIAIGLMIYYADMGIIGGHERGRNYENPKEQPWANESQIDSNNAGKKKAAVSTKKVNITSTLILQGPVTSGKDSRGTIVLTIDPNGTCRGKWHCAYSYTHSAHVNDANFIGNTMVNSITDASGKPDPSKLAFGARGAFTQKSTNLDTGEVTLNSGSVYVNGQIGLDHKAFGKVSITTNKKWHGDYDFTAEPQN